MKIEDAINLAQDLGNHVLPYGTKVTYKVNKRLKRALGRTRHWGTIKNGVVEVLSHTIELNYNFVIHNDAVHVRHTILHELAHVMSPINAGHGSVWKKCLKSLLASDEVLSKAIGCDNLIDAVAPLQINGILLVRTRHLKVGSHD